MHLLERHAEDAREEEEARDPRHPSELLEEVGELLGPCAPRDLALPLLGERRLLEVASAPPRVQLAQRGGHALDVVGGDDDARPGVADQLGGGAVGRERRRGSGARRPGTRRPCRRALPFPSRRPPGSGAAAPPSRAAAPASACAGRTEWSSSRSPRSSVSAHSRSAERKSPTNRATTSSSPDCASAVRNGRGSRLPKNEPVCVRRNRSDGRLSSPAKSSKSEPFGTVTTRPRGERSRTSSAMASETQVTASAKRADEPRDGVLALLLRAHEEALRVAVLVRDDRVAQVRDPRDAGRALDRGADEMHRRGRRGRQHDVDALAAHDPDRRRDRPSRSSSRSRPGRAAGARRAAAAWRPARGPPSRAAPRQACDRVGRGSARGAPTRGSAPAARRRGGSTSGRPARARGSRCPARAGASPA